MERMVNLTSTTANYSNC